jgi:hypothetical protein
VSSGYGQQIRAWTDTNAGTANNDGSENTTGTLTDTDRNPWRYASGYYDQDTQMLKVRTRYYNPRAGPMDAERPQGGIP